MLFFTLCRAMMKGMCNDKVKKGETFVTIRYAFGSGRSFAAAAADASSVVARKKKTLKTGAVVGTTTSTSSSSSSLLLRIMRRRIDDEKTDEKIGLKSTDDSGVFDSIEDAAWNAAVAEV